MALPKNSVSVLSGPTPPGDTASGDSTNFAPAFAQTRFLPVVELEYEDGEVEQRLDVMNHSYNRLVEIVTEWQPYPYDGTEHLTTICWKCYGNTTLIWLLLEYNGFMHPLEIEPGTIIKIPDRGQINKYFLQTQKTNSIGKVVKL